MIDLEGTLLGGQCFGWRRTERGFQSVLGGHLVTIRDERDIHAQGLDQYFDMDGPYEEAREYLASLCAPMRKAVELESGIHILRQDPWEATVSFLMSQNNNIKRIRSMYRALSDRYGSEVEEGWHAFPSQEQLRQATEEELRELHFGYRVPYIVAMARNFQPVDSALSTGQARKMLTGQLGIGPKVADCILLFGYHRMDTFPMDTWMKKVMGSYFPGKDGSYFAPYQALAQQYLFQAAQSGRLPC